MLPSPVYDADADAGCWMLDAGCSSSHPGPSPRGEGAATLCRARPCAVLAIFPCYSMFVLPLSSPGPPRVSLSSAQRENAAYTQIL